MVFGTPHVEKSSPSGSQVGRSQCTVPKHGIYHLYVSVYIYTSIHLYMYTCKHTCTHVHMQSHMYTYIYIYTYIHIHIQPMGAESSPSWTPQIHGNPMEGLLINMAGVGKTQCHKPSPKELLIINMAARVAHIVPQYPQIFPRFFH